jgi:hypothetical protein
MSRPLEKNWLLVFGASYAVTVMMVFGVSVESAEIPKIKSYLLTRARDLSRAVVVYHYGPRDKMGFESTGPVDPLSPQRIANIRERTDLFWSTDSTHADMGPGLYASGDPTSASSFGKGKFALYELTLKKGIRFLDMRNNPSATLPPDVIEELTALGAKKSFFGDNAVTEWSFFFKRWRGVVLSHLREQKIGFIVYDYPSALPGFCSSPIEDRSNAFVIVDHAAVDFDQTYVLTADADFSDGYQHVRDRVLRFFQQQSPARLWDSSIEQRDFKAWALQHTFGCGNFAEDRRPQS